MTFNPPGFRVFILLVAGFALKSLSKIIEHAGDLAANPGTRLINHLSALAVLLAAFACFIWGLKLIFFDKSRAVPQAPTRLVDMHPGESVRDADAPTPRPRGFGRKGL